MKVKDVMTPHAQTIWLTESLADAARMMWENDCGVRVGRRTVDERHRASR